MGMFEHRQVFAAVQLDGELGRQRVVAAVRLEPQQQPRRPAGARPATGADRGPAAGLSIRLRTSSAPARDPCRGPRPASSEAADKPLFLAATDAAQLQVGTVGRLDHAAGAIPRRGRHGACLGGVQAAGVELDAADAAVQRLDDTQQAGTGRRTWYGQGRRGLVVVQKRYSNRRRGDRTAVPRDRPRHRYTPPDVGTRDWFRRQVSGSQPGVPPGEEPPLRAAFPVIQWRMAQNTGCIQLRGQPRLGPGFEKTAAPCSLFGPRWPRANAKGPGTDERAIMPPSPGPENPFRPEAVAGPSQTHFRSIGTVSSADSTPPWLTLVGIGEDGYPGLGKQARRALLQASRIVGAARQLELLPPCIGAARETWPTPFSLEPLLARRGQPTCVLASGDRCCSASAPVSPGNCRRPNCGSCRRPPLPLAGRRPASAGPCRRSPACRWWRVRWRRCRHRSTTAGACWSSATTATARPPSPAC